MDDHGSMRNDGGPSKSHQITVVNTFTLLSRKLARNESCETFHTTLRGFAQVFNMSTFEDIFTLNLANGKIGKKNFLKKSLDLAQCLEVSINLNKRKQFGG